MKEFLLIPEAKEEIILYLIKELLNEERFAKVSLEEILHQKMGKNKIKQQLRLKRNFR